MTANARERSSKLTPQLRPKVGKKNVATPPTQKVCFVGAIGFKSIGACYSYEDTSSVLDFDFIFFTPALPIREDRKVHDTPAYDEANSRFFEKYLAHWNEQFREALEHGKTIILYCRAIEDCYVLTAGARSRELRTSYEFFRDAGEFVVRNGTVISQVSQRSGISELLRFINDFVDFKVIRRTGSDEIFFVSKTGEYAVGGYDSRHGGHILFAPAIDVGNLKKTADEEWDKYRERQNDLFRGYVERLLKLANVLGGAAADDPPPAWASEAALRTARENEYLEKAIEIRAQAAALESEAGQIDLKAEALAKHRNLLFASGDQLEDAVRSALRLMGFAEVERFDDGTLEFDALFSSTEGRFIGEVEGRDTKAIELTKMRQLSDNVLAEMELSGTGAFRIPVLFGNAARLVNPPDRPEFFTEGCLIAAKRNSASLVRTTDLYDVVRRVIDGAGEEYLASCRAALRDCQGGIVQFPVP